MVDPSSTLPAEAPPADSDFDRLLAALLTVDPSAHVIERSKKSAAVKITEAGAREAIAVLLEPDDGPPAEALAELQTRIENAMAALQSRRGVHLHFVVVNARGLGAPELLNRIIPRTTMFRAERHAHVWSPPNKLETVRGLGSRVLAQAVKSMSSGRVANLETMLAERGDHADEARRFFARVQGQPPVVTWTIGAISVAMFGLQMLWGGGEPMAAASRMGASAGDLIRAGQIWRLLAPMVLHANFIHLAFNMVALFSFSAFLEKFLGWHRYLLLYVVSGLGGSLAGLLRSQDVISVGASGGIWGLMVAGAVLITWPRGRLPTLIAASQRGRVWAPVVINALYSFQAGIDWLAHLGGGVIGGLLMASGFLTAGIPAAAAASDERAPPARSGRGNAARGARWRAARDWRRHFPFHRAPLGTSFVPLPEPSRDRWEQSDHRSP